MRFIPTSMTAAPGLTSRPSTRRGEPTAATRMSARAADLGEVPGARVAHGHGRVRVQQQRRHRAAHQDRAPDHHRLGPLDLDAGTCQQLHHARGRARDEAGAALGQEPRASRSQPVDVLGRVDRRDHGVLVDAVGQRQLDEDPVDALVDVELPDQGQQLLLRGRGASPRWIERMPTSSVCLRLLRT